MRIPSRSELLDFAWAQVELLRAQAIIWRRPIGRLIAGSRSQAKSTIEVATKAAEQRAATIALAVDRAARRGVFRPKCLARSMALHRMLERSGIGGSVIKIGVRREGEELLAHAGVEYMGNTLIDSPSAVAAFSRLTEARLADLSASSR
jgi:hypothetical protein